MVARVGRGQTDNPWRNVHLPQGCRQLQSLYHVVASKRQDDPLQGNCPAAESQAWVPAPAPERSQSGSLFTPATSCFTLKRTDQGLPPSRIVKHSFLAAVDADCIIIDEHQVALKLQNEKSQGGKHSLRKT